MGARVIGVALLAMTRNIVEEILQGCTLYSSHAGINVPVAGKTLTDLPLSHLSLGALSEDQ